MIFYLHTPVKKHMGEDYRLQSHKVREGLLSVWQQLLSSQKSVDAYIFPNTTVKGQSPFQEQIRIREQELRYKVGGNVFL